MGGPVTYMNTPRLIALALAFGLTVLAVPAEAIDRAAVEKLAFGDTGEKLDAIATLVADGDLHCQVKGQTNNP